MNEERKIIIASESGISIRSIKDITDVIAACIGAEGLILAEDDLPPDFFELRTGLAGELFQKFMNYRVRVAIVLSSPEAYGKRFGELAYEHSSHAMIRFVRSMDDAKTWFRS
jgi:hypothetical protein